MKINKYPDGSSYVTLEESEQNAEIIEAVMRINSYSDLMHLVQICDVIQHNKKRGIITIPCLIDAQADKRFNQFESSGLAIVAKLLNLYDNITFKIFHPHNPEVVEALFNNVEIIDNTNYIKSVIEYIKVKEGPEYVDNMILMSTDAGGFKPLMKLCDKIEWTGESYSASKARKWVDNKSVLNQVVDRKDFSGKHILLIDDLSVRGGTFKGLQKILSTKNTGDLMLAVSHVTLQDMGKDSVCNYYKRMFTTNSKFDTYIVRDSEGVEMKDSNLHISKMF